MPASQPFQPASQQQPTAAANVYTTVFGNKFIQEEQHKQRCTIISDNGYTERMLRVWERLGRMVRLRGWLLPLYVFYVATHTFLRLDVLEGTRIFLLSGFFSVKRIKDFFFWKEMFS